MTFGRLALVLAIVATATSAHAQSPSATSPKPQGIQPPAGSEAQIKLGGPGGGSLPARSGTVTVVTFQLALEIAGRMGLTDVNRFSENDNGYVRGTHDGKVPVLLSLGPCKGETCSTSITFYAMFGKQDVDLAFVNAYNVKYVAKMVSDAQGVHVMTNLFMDGGANVENLVGSAKVFLRAVDIALTFKP